MTNWEPLLTRLRETTGFEIGPERMPEVDAAARRAMARAGVGSVETWLDGVQGGRAPLTDVVEEVVVGETYFFREAEQLGLLGLVLPALPRPIRLWSAGCATGEEPYTLAMVAHELGLEGSTSILATDLSEASLVRARDAVYDDWSFRGPDAARAKPWARLVPGGPTLRWTLDDRIRRAVTFQSLNLVSDPYPSGQNIIFCRNVLIYLQRSVVADLARRFYDALAEGGWLVLASSDPPLTGLAPFTTVTTPHGMFYQRVAEARSTPKPPIRGPVRPVRLSREPRAPGPVPDLQASVPTCDDAIARVLAQADAGDVRAAERAAATALHHAPLNAELHYLRAVFLIELRDPTGAVASLRHALYLDPTFIMAHLRLALVLREIGDWNGSKRAFHRSHRLSAAMAHDEPVPMGDGASAGYVRSLALREERR